MFGTSLCGALNRLNLPQLTNSPQISLGKVARLFSTLDNLVKVQYKDVNKLSTHKEAVIIDVREPEELIEHGSIPNAINIPLGQVETVLKNMSDTEFANRFGRVKPTKETLIVFSCMKGVRSEKAQITALGLNYKNVKNYAGGWIDWAENRKSS